VKRISLLLASVLLAAAIAAAAATARNGAPPARSALFHTVELRKTHLGKILVTASGYTLFAFSKDARNKDACAKISGCLEAWPIKEAQGRPSGGSGVKSSLLSTLKLSKGRTQVTYAGHPLYIYAGENAPGQTEYVGAKQFGGIWYALNAAGQLVK
jgi:predicted lipoprotein with Yx(FWY)xxD motif